MNIATSDARQSPPRSFLLTGAENRFRPSLAKSTANRSSISTGRPAARCRSGWSTRSSHYLIDMNANHGGLFATSRESDAMLDEAHAAVADLLGTSHAGDHGLWREHDDADVRLQPVLARTWQPGDEVIVTRLDHDANVTPWVLAARDAGAKVRFVDIHPEDCTLDLDAAHGPLSPRTRLVAVGCASNAVGTINPMEEICRLAHAAGAQVFLDAVHYAPHGWST